MALRETSHYMKAAEALMVLINSQPRSPTKAELVACLRKVSSDLVYEDYDEEMDEGPYQPKKAKTVPIAVSSATRGTNTGRFPSKAPVKTKP